MRPTRNRSPKAHTIQHRVLACVGLLGLAMLASDLSAQPVRCHLNYGGMNRILTVPPTVCPQQVWPQVEGNSLAFRVINPAPNSGQRSITIDTHVLQGDTLRPAHQAQYLGWETAAPTTSGLPYGFTGLQTVPNADSGHSLSYWCERMPNSTAGMQPTAIQDDTCTASR